MKSKFEQSIKDSLEGFELPYDPHAWTAMSQKLDAIQPVASPKGGGTGKWFAAAGIVIATTIGAVYLTNGTDSTTTNPVAEHSDRSGESTNETNKQTTEPAAKTTAADHSGETNAPTETTHSTAAPDQGTHVATSGIHKQVEPDNTDGTVGKTPKTPTSPGNTGISTSQDPDPIQEAQGSPSTHVVLPTLKDLCQGEKMVLRNTNAFDLILIAPNRDEVRLRPKSVTTVDIDQAGKYALVRQHQRNSELATFKAIAAPKLDFSIDDQTQFEQGIPSIPLETYSEGSDFTWSFEGSSLKQYGSTAHATFFKKGTHTITLSATGDKGCKATISKTVSIDEDYNLLAPNAFIPEHSDNRKNRFIPYALSVRNVEFNMIVIDPKSGAVIYESGDVQGWDGIDRTTGRMADINTTYIWKVTLKKPLPGERSEYSGTVAVLRM